jgi:hypothetical protein
VATRRTYGNRPRPLAMSKEPRATGGLEGRSVGVLTTAQCGVLSKRLLRYSPCFSHSPMGESSLNTSLAVRTRARGVLLFLGVSASVLLGGGLVVVLREGNVQARIAPAAPLDEEPELAIPNPVAALNPAAEAPVGRTRGKPTVPAIVGDPPTAPSRALSIVAQKRPAAATAPERALAPDIVRTSPF